MNEQAMGTVMAACLRVLSSGSLGTSSSQGRTSPAPLALCDEEKPKEVQIELLPKKRKQQPGHLGAQKRERLRSLRGTQRRMW